MPLFGRSYQPFIAIEGLYLIVLFAVVLRWVGGDRTRAGRAVLAAFGAGIVNIGLDVIAHHFGWWRYPEATTPFGPLVYYAEAGLGFGLLALVFWRLHERFARGALVMMVGAMCVYGPARDHLTDHLIGLIAFRSGAVVVIAVALFMWVIPFRVAVFLTRTAQTTPAPPARGGRASPVV